MKKRNILGTVVALVTFVAAVGGTIYVFRDKIKESKLYKDMDLGNKLSTVTDFISKLINKVPSSKEDFLDAAESVDEDFDTVFDSDDSSEREYVSIKINSQDEEKADDVSINNASSENNIDAAESDDDTIKEEDSDFELDNSSDSTDANVSNEDSTLGSEELSEDSSDNSIADDEIDELKDLDKALDDFADLKDDFSINSTPSI